MSGDDYKRGRNQNRATPPNWMWRAKGKEQQPRRTPVLSLVNWRNGNIITKKSIAKINCCAWRLGEGKPQGVVFLTLEI